MSACPPLVWHIPMESVFCCRRRRAWICKGHLFKACNSKLLCRRWCLSICLMARCFCQWKIFCRCPLLVLVFLAQVFPFPLNMLFHITYDILDFSLLVGIPFAPLFLCLKLCLSFRLGISVRQVFLGTFLVALYQRIWTCILGLQCEFGFWLCVQTRRLVMFPPLPVLLDLLVLLNVGVVPPLEVYQSCLLGQCWPVISGLV